MSDPPQVAETRSARGAWFALFAAVLVVSAFRLNRLDLPLERDEGEYAYGAQLLSAGEFSYERLRTMKLPGTHAATAVIFALFGESKEAMRGGLVALNAASMLLVFLLGRRIFGPPSGAWIGAAAAASFGVLALNHGVLGLYAHAEHFALPPILLAALLLHRAQGRETRGGFLAAGTCLGLGIVMKQQAFVFLLFGLLVAASPALRESPRDVARGVRRCALVLAGAVLPAFLVAATFIASGGFEPFWLWTVTLAREYASTISIGQGIGIFAQQAGNVFGGAPLVWLAAIGGAVAVCTDARMRAQRWFLGSFGATAFLATCPGLYFREHYFVFVLPAAALFVGAAVEWTVDVVRRRASSSPLPAQLGIGVALACVLASPAIGQSGYLFTFEPERVSRVVYAENPFAEAVRMGEFLRERSKPGDLVAILGSEPELLFYARRRSPTGHIYMYPLMEKNPHAVELQKQMIAEIEAARPRWIVSCGEWLSWMQQPESHDEIIEWGASYTAAHYRLVALAEVVSETETVYRFDADVATYAPTTERFVLVFERAD